MGKVDTLTALKKSLSAPRMQLYLERANGDCADALEFYSWNCRLAAAFFIDLGHLEVALRNTIDARMAARRTRRGLPGSWLEDPEGELGRAVDGRGHRQPYRDIDGARRRVQQNHKDLTHDQVLSETSFGLWHQLVSKRWTNLWPDLAAAFPYAPTRTREAIAEPISDLRDLRNRIGHHHRIWTLPCGDRHRQLLAVAQFIDPELSRWILANSAVPAVLRALPAALRSSGPEEVIDRP